MVFIPEVNSPLRSATITMPDAIQEASGIRLYGNLIKSVAYTVDVALIANLEADAILCVYPFTPNTQILRAVSMVADAPIIAGVGGGLTKGDTSAFIAFHAQENNASAVILNGPADVETVSKACDAIDIPVIYTVINKQRPLAPYVEAGVDIINVSGGHDTTELVRWVREQYPEIPIMASGGKTEESIRETIAAGANAISYTAFGMVEHYFHEKMAIYRDADVADSGVPRGRLRFA